MYTGLQDNPMVAIYHITHQNNLANILATGGLWCDAQTSANGLRPTEIAHANIKERRSRRRVPVSMDGVLADYVPFYFCPRSPMLYSIHHGYVTAYQDGQAPLLHLRTSTEAVADCELRFAFTDGHATMALSRYFDDLTDLNQLDWEVINSRYWSDTASDNDRKRRKQAEFLVYRFFPWNLVQEIGVINRQMADVVTNLIQNQAHQPIVSICRNLYY